MIYMFALMHVKLTSKTYAATANTLLYCIFYLMLPKRLCAWPASADLC